MEFKYKVGEWVMVKFRGKTTIGSVETAIRRGLRVMYDVRIDESPRLQRRKEDELAGFLKV